MTVEETIERYFRGISPRTIRSWARAGKFGPKVVYTGRWWLIPERGIIEFVRRHTIPVGKAPTLSPPAVQDPTGTQNPTQFRDRE